MLLTECSLWFHCIHNYITTLHSIGSVKLTQHCHPGRIKLKNLKGTWARCGCTFPREIKFRCFSSHLIHEKFSRLLCCMHMNGTGSACTCKSVKIEIINNNSVSANWSPQKFVAIQYCKVVYLYQCYIHSTSTKSWYTDTCMQQEMKWLAYLFRFQVWLLACYIRTLLWHSLYLCLSTQSYYASVCMHRGHMVLSLCTCMSVTWISWRLLKNQALATIISCTLDCTGVSKHAWWKKISCYSLLLTRTACRCTCYFSVHCSKTVSSKVPSQRSSYVFAIIWAYCNQFMCVSATSISQRH